MHAVAGWSAQKTITACVLWAESKRKRRKEKRRFGTFTWDLVRPAEWLCECSVTHVAVKSTGVYWKPVWNVLDGQFEEVLLVKRAAHQGPDGPQNGPEGQRVHRRYVQHGLVKGSFVLPRATRDLRDLTRYRVSLAQECNRVANRIQKVLEDATASIWPRWQRMRWALGGGR